MAVKIINFSKKIKEDNLPLVIGYFGCVHVMHYQLLTRTNNFNILTFTDLISKKDHQLYNYPKRIAALKKFNPKTIYVLDVKNDNMTGFEFLQKFLLKLNPSEIIVGEDFRFGSDGISTRILKNHFKVYELKYNANISTSKIHDLVAEGKIEEANDFLALYCSFESKWIGGLKKARKIGFPTINIKNERPFVLKEGSYVSKIHIGNKVYKSVTFIGQSQLIKHDGPTIETHVLGKKIWPRLFYPPWIRNNIKVDFLKFIRANKKFNNLNELKKAIQSDVEICQQYFNKHKI